MVKVYEIILTFDTVKPNEEIPKEIEQIILNINNILSRNMMDSLPQIYIDADKKSKISIVPIKTEDD
jgi:hypothetical protein